MVYILEKLQNNAGTVLASVDNPQTDRQFDFYISSTVLGLDEVNTHGVDKASFRYFPSAKIDLDLIEKALNCCKVAFSKHQTVYSVFGVDFMTDLMGSEPTIDDLEDYCIPVLSELSKSPVAFTEGFFVNIWDFAFAKNLVSKFESFKQKIESVEVSGVSAYDEAVEREQRFGELVHSLDSILRSKKWRDGVESFLGIYKTITRDANNFYKRENLLMVTKQEDRYDVDFPLTPTTLDVEDISVFSNINYRDFIKTTRHPLYEELNVFGKVYDRSGDMALRYRYNHREGRTSTLTDEMLGDFITTDANTGFQTLWGEVDYKYATVSYTIDSGLSELSILFNVVANHVSLYFPNEKWGETYLISVGWGVRDNHGKLSLGIIISSLTEDSVFNREFKPRLNHGLYLTYHTGV